MQQHRINVRGQIQRDGAHHQTIRQTWVPKLGHIENERTANSEGKHQRNSKVQSLSHMSKEEQNLHSGC